MIAGFRLNKIFGERKTNENVTREMTQKVDIKSVKKSKNEVIGDHVLINFEFEYVFSPEAGEIKLEGDLMYRDADLENLVKEKDNKLELQPKILMEVTNFIFENAMIEVINTAKKLYLPVPLNVPKINFTAPRSYPIKSD
jgi:hypothetical protein